jgi:hypothetical protein
MTDYEGAAPPTDLSEGWKPDPTGASDFRWWDGVAWTERVGAKQKSTPSAAGPNRVCPHCGALSQTNASKCPSCGKGYKKRTGLKIAAAIIAVGLVGIIGCSVLLVGGANEVADEIDAELAKNAITRAQFDALEIGMTQAEVRASTGKPPVDRQRFESEGFLSEEPTTSSCIYYNEAGGEFLEIYQLCFDEGKLTSKNDY